MKQETKQCQNCKNKFVIEPEDFDFYKKIDVPPPTWCPECRAKRRALFRNERTFYKRTCDSCNRKIIAIYDKHAPFPVYCNDCWHLDNWDPLDYGNGYNFEKPFFEQNQELRHKVPRAATVGRDNINSAYINIGAENKNCYFLVESSTNEDCAYGYWLEDHCKDVVDSAFLRKIEVAYETISSWRSYKLLFSKDCQNINEGAFLFDCNGCNNCIGCANLRNKSYYFLNKHCAEEEYKKRKALLDTGSQKVLAEFKKKYAQFLIHQPHRFAYIVKSTNCSGNYIINSKNCRHSFFVEDGENIKYGVRVMYNVKDCMDCDTVGVKGELCYESINTALGVYDMKFCMRCWTGNNSQYCDNCDNINTCFGCVGLRNGKYSILNKQYTEKEYKTLVPKIIEHMNEVPYKDKKRREYRYGEFFPPELSPFAYNETIAQEYFPLTKEEAEEQGYRWREPETKEYEITIKPQDFPDHIKDVKDSILKETIGCEHAGKCNEQCTTAFKIIPQELQFYKKMNLPLPRLCPNCRHYQRLKQRNPLKLWHRQCMCNYEVYQNTIKHNHHPEEKCPNEFETTYAPDRKEIIYCEQCYQQEVV